MPPAPLPASEADRLAALHACALLDTQGEAAFDELAVLAATLTSSPIAMISLVDADRVWFKARLGIEATEAPRDHAFCAHAILDPNEALIVPDLMLDQRFADNPLVAAEPRLRFYAGAPLVSSDGHALGTLRVMDHVPHELDAVQRQSLASLARAVTTTIELHRTALRLRSMALTDPLTGVGNRRSFLETLDKVMSMQRRHGQPFALLYLDLDGFKQVNDQHGHNGGDAVLREVAAALVGSLRREDTVARLGGDEFAAVLVGGAAESAALVAERVRMAVQARLAAAGKPVTASVGAVSFTAAPRDAVRALGAADAVMYAAKHAGKNRALHRTCGADGGPETSPLVEAA